MGHVEISDRGPADRRAVDLLVGERLQHLVLEAERRGGQAALIECHGGDRTAHDADLGVRIDRLDAGDRAVGPNRQYDAGPVIGFGELQPGLVLHLGLGDRVRHDVASGSPQLMRSDDPDRLQRHPDLFRDRLPKLDLKPWRVALAAGERQRIGVRALADRASPADDVERPRLGRRREQTGGQTAAPPTPAISLQRSLLQRTDIGNEIEDLLGVSDRAAERRHRRFLAVHDTECDEWSSRAVPISCGPLPADLPPFS